MKRIEVNCQTGETKEIQLTAEEIAEIESRAPDVQVESPQIDPVDKLKMFLSSNPDVAELLK